MLCKRENSMEKNEPSVVKEELDDTQAPAMTHGSNELRKNNMF